MPKNQQFSFLSTVTGAALLGLAGLHAYWGLGGTWPGHDAASLGRKVYGGDTQQLPPPAACFAVAGALTIPAVALVLAVRPSPLQLLSRRVGQLAGATLLARGGLGFTLPRFTQANPEFRVLNRRIYSPLCLGLGAAMLVSTKMGDTGVEE